MSHTWMVKFHRYAPSQEASPRGKRVLDACYMSKKIDFAEPPVVEVAAGVQFERLPGFQAPHFGLFWQTVRSDFPHFQPAPPRLKGGEEPFALSEVPTRCWFLSEDRRRLLQLQQGSFVFNWRRRDTDDAGAYPEFAHIYPEFVRHLTGLRKFAADEALGAIECRECELTYVNFLPFEQLESFEYPGDVMVDHTRMGGERFMPAPSNFNWTTHYDFPAANGELVVRCITARRTVGKKDELIRFELSFVGKPDGHSQDDLDIWFGRAHDHIIEAFSDLTDQTAQRDVWRKR